MNRIYQIYNQLLKTYGKQGWWPLLDVKGCNPTKTGSIKGYHPGNYSYPKNKKQQFEIIIGAVLTQNTSWPNVEKALINLKKINAIDPHKILNLDKSKLKDAIRPAGYYNQKSRYIRNISEFYLGLKGRIPFRNELMAVKGIGNETADSILLYAYKEPEFVVDAYTRRLLLSHELINENAKYGEIKELFESNLKRDHILFQEYHALIVEHGKN